MLRNKSYLYLLLVFVTSFWSCKKNQDFNYSALNELTINAGETELSVIQFDVLKINPEIIQSKAAGESFTYQWKIYPENVVKGVEPQIISTEKSLQATITVPPIENRYYLEYKVTNSATGVATFKLFKVKVTSVFKDGWLVTNTNAGKAQLGFIRSDYRLFDNPAESVNQTTYAGNAVGAATFKNPGGDRFGICFITDNGMYRFNANDFLTSGRVTTTFKPIKDKFAYSVSKFTTEEYAINDGNLYAATLIDDPIDVFYTERLTGDYQLFPKVITSTLFTTFFYDNKHKRFMSVNFGSFDFTPVFSAPSPIFDLGNTGMLMVGAMDGAKRINDEDYFFVMQDANGERYLYGLSGARAGFSQKMLNSPNIGNAKAFAASLTLRHMYYAADNQIYLYDMLANSSKLLYTLPGGTNIKELQIQPTDGKTLVAAANRGTSGEVYFFKIDTQGNFVNQGYDHKTDGFGEISTITYRKLN